MLNGRVVLITGASQGVGRGLALAAGTAGAAVVVTARNVEAASRVAEEIVEGGSDAIACHCDVTNRADVEAAVGTALSRFGRLDAVVHNATSRLSGRPTKLQDVTDEDWDDQVAVALRAAFFLARASFTALRDAGGTLVVLTSNAGIEGSLPLPVYSTVKGAERAFVKSLAREWGPHGIRVNALAPVAMTPAIERFFAAQPQMRNFIERGAALRRIGDPTEDIGRVLNFLIGNDSAFVTGQTLLVNGGATMV